MKAPILAALLALASLPAYAANPATAPEHYADEPLAGQGSEGPGGLTPAQIQGKHLLDANGKEVGIVVGVSPDGGSAYIRVASGEKRSVPMRKLSLGNGPNTVIESGGSDADKLNRMEMSQ